MMGFFEATRWAVAQTVTEVFVISMSIARELSVLDPRTKALALKAVTARMHWEAVCEASYAQEHVSITPAMMTYANYQINPEGVTQVANKKKSDTKSRRAEARADLEDVVANTITLLAEAEVYEQQGEYRSRRSSRRARTSARSACRSSPRSACARTWPRADCGGARPRAPSSTSSTAPRSRAATRRAGAATTATTTATTRRRRRRSRRRTRAASR